MALTHSPESRPQPSGTRLLDHPGAPEDTTRHRLPRQTRGGAPVLGVTAMAAALGATGFSATAAAAATPPAVPATPTLSAPDETSQALLETAADPGLALAARIQQQADSRRTAAEEAARLEAAREAAAKRAAQAEADALAAAVAEQAAAAEQPAPVVERPATEQPAAGAHVLPLVRYTLSAHHGQPGSHWAHLRTGLDFAAATGASVSAVAGGVVTSAGWSGAYGYRVIQTLSDGTEIWYCHLSSIAAAAGPVAPGAVLGTVGATGNASGSATGPHLHLEVRPSGGAPVDPLAWFQQRGVTP